MKKGMKRVIAFVMALVMTFSIQMPERVEAASASDTYNGGYGIEDILTYYFQQCEIDAREYAESAVADYYLRIREYIETEKLVNTNITFKIEEM